MQPHIAILGTVEVSGAGRTTALPGANVPALLSLLALTPGRAVSNDRIIQALWPRADPVKARRSLISLVNQLNVALGTHFGPGKPVVSMRSVGRVLDIDPARIDVVEFERRIETADAHLEHGRFDAAAEAYHAALRLWRGEPFGGVDLTCFVEPTARLRALREHAEAGSIEASLRVGRGSQLVPQLVQRVLADPADEHVAGAAARALYQAGRSAEALRVLRDCMKERRARRMPIGLEIRRLEVDVLAHAIEPGSGVVAIASSAGTGRGSLIGRELEQIELDAWFASEDVPTAMVITGDEGMGKTCLVDAWLASLAPVAGVRRLHATDESGAPAPFGALTGDADLPPDVLVDRAVRHVSDPEFGVDLIVVEDAHRLDVASIGLLRHLLLHAGDLQLHVLLVARSPDASTNHALAQLSSDLVRAGRRHHLHLRPFERTELDELIARHRGDAASDQITPDQLLQLTAGNPMFATEVLLAPHDGPQVDSAVPPRVASTLARHLRPLSPRSRRIIQLAARRGGSGDPRVLAAEAGVDELAVIDALDEVAGGRLVHVDAEGGRYRFVHELARRTAADSA